MDFPHSAEFERLALRRLIQDEVSSELRILDETDFHVELHQDAFRALRAGKLDLLKEFFATLRAGADDPQVRDGTIYSTLRDHALARAAMRAAAEVIAEGSSYDDVKAYLNRSAQRFNAIANKTTLEGVVHVQDAIIEAFEGVTITAERRKLFMPYGYEQLDRITGGMRPGEVILVAGGPNSGKSSFVLNVMLNVARAAAGTVFLASLKMTRDMVARRVLQIESKVDSAKLRRGLLLRADWPAMVKAATDLSDLPIFIDDDASPTLADIEERASDLHGLGLVVIMNVHQIKPEHRGETRVREMTEIAHGLKRLAKKLSVPVLGIAHTKRSPDEPGLGDLRDSSELEEMADQVLFLNDDGWYTNRAEWAAAGDTNRRNICVRVAKQNDGPALPVTLEFDRTFGAFFNKTEEERK